jgi:phosphoglycerate dehydrogenase-like enzyme
VRLVTVIAEQYDPVGRAAEIVRRELEPDGWAISGDDGWHDADAVLTLMRPVTEETLVLAPSLRLIQAASRGYDVIDARAAATRGIPVCNVHAAGHADTVAEHTLGLLLAVAKRIAEGHAAIAGGGWPGQELLREGLTELHGKVLGIVGMGEIGRQVATRAHAFGMRLAYTDVRACEELERRFDMARVELDELLQQADVVTLHVPLDTRTDGLIGRRELGLMKPGAVLLNTSRGPVVDLEAVTDALLEGRIRAGLDVFDPEPPPAGHPIRTARNLVCSPHIAGVTAEAVERVVLAAVANVRRLGRGEPLEYVVNGVEA